MATRVQLRRGTTLQNNAFTGAEGELTYDTTSKGLRIHDGSTQGGRFVDTVVSFIKPTAGNNYSWARVYASGWVEQGGCFSPSSAVADANYTINLPVTMANTHYTLLLTAQANTDLGWCTEQEGQRTTSSFIAQVNAYNSAGVFTAVSWEVKGMAA